MASGLHAYVHVYTHKVIFLSMKLVCLILMRVVNKQALTTLGPDLKLDLQNAVLERYKSKSDLGKALDSKNRGE